MPEQTGRAAPRPHSCARRSRFKSRMAYPAATVDSPDYYRARAAAAILGGYSSARLFTEVREKRGLCYSVYSTYEGQPNRAAMLCYAGTSADRAQQTLDVMLAEIEQLGRDGVALDELETMRAGLKSSLIMAQESSMSRSGIAGRGLVLSRQGAVARGDRRRARCADARERFRVRRRTAAAPRAHDPHSRAGRAHAAAGTMNRMHRRSVA